MNGKLFYKKGARFERLKEEFGNMEGIEILNIDDVQIW